MNFIQAENLARRRRVTLPDSFYAETALDMRHRMFTVSGLMNIGEINHVNDLFQSALKSGGSLAQFKNDMAAAGYALPNGRVETIYRTNAQTAYNQGRLNQSLVHTDTHPYFAYDAIDDERTREEHRALDNLVFHIIRDQERWERIYPPNGYNCRCRMRTLTLKQARRLMKQHPIDNIDAVLGENQPDKGFGGLPMTTADMESMLYGRVNDLPTDPIVRQGFVDQYERLVEPIRVQKTIELVDLGTGFEEIIGNYVEALRIARQKTVSKITKAAYNMAGSVTTREAMFIADYLLDGSALDTFLRTGGAGMSQAAVANHQSYLAAITGVFDNRLDLRLPWTAPLYRPTAQAAKIGDVLSFESFAQFTRKAAGGESLVVLRNKFGRIIPVENMTSNAASGAFLADIGEQYQVVKVLNDQFVDRKLYKQVIYVENKGRTLTRSTMDMIQAGRRAWLTNGVTQ